MRRQAREVVYKMLFSELFNDEEEALFNELVVEACLEKADVEFAKKLLSTIKENKEVLNYSIGKLAKNYRLDRIYPTDRCALMIGMCEIRYFEDVPNIVAIDEALSLCRTFSTAQSLSFVNGIFAEYKKLVEGGKIAEFEAENQPFEKSENEFENLVENIEDKDLVENIEIENQENKD